MRELHEFGKVECGCAGLDRMDCAENGVQPFGFCIACLHGGYAPFKIVQDLCAFLEEGRLKTLGIAERGGDC